MKVRMTSRMRKYVLNIAIVTIAFFAAVPLVKASDQTDVRSTVQHVFEQLKSQNYSALYDLLPGASRNRMSRDRFVSALQRAQGFYQLDSIDIGATRVMGNLAVVDTVLYGRVLNPIQAEGKIVVQQYLLREDGKCRLVTSRRCESFLPRIRTLARHLKSASRESTSSRIINGSSSMCLAARGGNSSTAGNRVRADRRKTVARRPRVRRIHRDECDDAAPRALRAPRRGESG